MSDKDTLGVAPTPRIESLNDMTLSDGSVIIFRGQADDTTEWLTSDVSYNLEEAI